ncbi:MAG: hypothetical protein ACR2MN_13275 [Acidimicrobiales bacterium]
MHATTPDARAYETAELVEMSAEDQFRLAHAAQFPPDIYPAGAILPMSFGPKTNWTFKPPWGDVDAQWAWASKQLGQSLYRVAGAQPADLSRIARGRKDTVRAVANLWLDLDTTRGVHKPEAMPCMTDAQAWDIIAAYPLFPTGVIDTGGGLLAWWGLDEAIDPHSAQGKALLQRHKDVLAGAHFEQGVAFDGSVPADPAQVTRLPCGVNGKPLPVVGGEWTAERVAQIDPNITTAPVHLIRLDTRNRYSAEQISDAISDPALPKLPPRVAKSRKKPKKGEYVHVCGGTDHPADQVCITLPMARLMRELPGMINSSDRLISWADAGLIPDDADDWSLTWEHEKKGGIVYAKLFRASFPAEAGHQPGPAVSTLTAFGAGTASVFGVEANTGRLCSWWFIRNIRCGGRGALAHNLAKLFVGDPDGLLEGLVKYPAPADLLAAHPELAEPSTAARQDARPVEQPTVREAMASMDGAMVWLDHDPDHGLFTVFGGERHGTWTSHMELERDESGEVVGEGPVDVRVWSAIMIRLPVERYKDGNKQQCDPVHEVGVLTADGRWHSAGHQLVEDSVLAAQRMLVRSAAPVRLWSSRDWHVIQDVLQVLGEGEDGQTWQTSMGWHGGSSYTAATSDMTPAGPEPGTLRALPEITNVGGKTVVTTGQLKPALANIGWPKVPITLAEHRRAAKAVKGFLGLTPNRPDIGATMLGTLFAAPLGLPSRPAIVVDGGSEIGKTLYLRCAQAFVSGVGVRNGSLSFSLSGTYTPKGCLVVMRQYDDGVFFLNDYCLNGPKRKDDLATETVNAALKAAFEESAGGVSTQSGGHAGRRDPRCAVIVSAEERASGQGIVNRCIELHMLAGDLVLGVRDPGGWVEEWDDTGLARELYGGYLAYLAERRAELGPDGMVGWANEVTRTMNAAHGVSRASDLVAGIATGWAVFRTYATAVGVADLIPTARDITTTLGSVVERSEVRNAEEAPVEVFLSAARDWMATGAAYLAGPQHEALPVEDPDLNAFGWRVNDYEVAEHQMTAICLGLVQPASPDGRLILLQRQGVEKLWRAMQRPEKVGQIYSALEERHVVEEHRGVVAPQLGLTTGTPPRGFAIRPEALGLVSEPYTSLAKRVDGVGPDKSSAPADIMPPTGSTRPTSAGGVALAESDIDTTTGPTTAALIEGLADTADADDEDDTDYYDEDEL